MDPSSQNHNTSIPGYCSYENDWGGASGTTKGVLLSSYLNRGGIRRPKPRESWINPTPYQLVSRKVNGGNGTCSRIWISLTDPKKKYFDRYHGAVGGGNGAPCSYANIALAVYPEGGPPGLMQYLRDMTYRSCYTKMRAKTVNVGVAIGEARQTVALVTQTAQRCAKAMILLRKGRWQMAARVLGVRPGRYSQDFGRKWLEWKYGWMPMVEDVYQSAVHLAQRNAGDWRVSVKSRQERPLVGMKLLGYGFAKVIGSCAGKIGVQTRFDFIPTSQFEPSKLGMTNPALIAWELIPFSFVVDQLVDVGAWLEGLDHSVAIADGVSCTSTFIKQKWSISGMNDEQTAGGYFMSYSNAHSGTVEYVSLSRIVGGVSPPGFPSLRNVIPGLGAMKTALNLLVKAFNVNLEYY